MQKGNNNESVKSWFFMTKLGVKSNRRWCIVIIYDNIEEGISGNLDDNPWLLGIMTKGILKRSLSELTKLGLINKTKLAPKNYKYTVNLDVMAKTLIANNADNLILEKYTPELYQAIKRFS